MRNYLLPVLALAAFSAGCSQEALESGEAAGEEKKAGVSGTLSFYTSQPDEDAQALVTAFGEKYPEAKVETFRSGTEEVISKLQAEQQAGSVQADVLLVADAVTFESLKEEDMLLNYASPEAEHIPEDFVDPDGAYAGYKNVKANGMGITKGNGGVLEAVASGEKTYGMVVDFVAARAKQEGSPVELVYPEDGVPVITEPIGIMKGTDNEETAKAFVDFVLSEEGQKLAAEIGYTPIREGIAAPEGLRTLDEMNILTAETSELLKAREEDKELFGGIFGQQ
jgi:iron(III) transport system substrate-binding protein